MGEQVRRSFSLRSTRSPNWGFWGGALSALQCRVTTEDPENNFIPDYGTITAYRSHCSSRS